MFCKNCGKEVLESDAFCPYCGSKIENANEQKEEKVEEVEATVFEEKISTPQPKKPWCIFAKVSRILGIVSLATCWIPFLIGISAGVPGIVFGILAKAKSPDKESMEMGRGGMVKSIIGSIVSFVTYILFIVVLAIIAALAKEDVVY